MTGEPAGERGFSGCPQAAHDLDVLVGPRDPVLPWHAEGLEFLFQPADADADADAEEQPTAGEPVNRRRSFRELDRVVLGEDQHPGAERDVLGYCREERDPVERRLIRT
jgi:hypothetical protein